MVIFSFFLSFIFSVCSYVESSSGCKRTNEFVLDIIYRNLYHINFEGIYGVFKLNTSSSIDPKLMFFHLLATCLWPNLCYMCACVCMGGWVCVVSVYVWVGHPPWVGRRVCVCVCSN